MEPEMEQTTAPTGLHFGGEEPKAIFVARGLISGATGLGTQLGKLASSLPPILHYRIKLFCLVNVVPTSSQTAGKLCYYAPVVAVESGTPI